MTTIRFFSLIILFAFAILQASATDGFVVESNRANIPVGIAINRADAVNIGQGGHIVIMTAQGQIIRRNGPYSGTGVDIFDDANLSPTSDDEDPSMIAALIDLVSEKGTAKNRTFATRGRPKTGFDAGPLSITGNMPIYCLPEGATAQFELGSPPQRTLSLVVNRLSEPTWSNRVEWPMGKRVAVWPVHWSPPDNGEYMWLAGQSGGRFTVVVYASKTSPLNSVSFASELLSRGCKTQAWAAVRQAINNAQVVE